MSLRTDFKDAIPVAGAGTARKYKMVDNGDGTVSFQDVTEYSQAGDKGQASVFNATNKEVNNHLSDQALHITTLACTKTDTVYALTGLTATAGKVRVMFAVPSAYAAGDTVTIDGTDYTLKTTDGSTLTAGAWAEGAVITGTADVDNKVLYVEPGTPDKLPNPAALSIAHGYNGNTGSYNGSTAKTVATPYMTFHTSTPGTVHNGEIWAVY